MFAGFIIIGVITVVELFVCHFHLWWVLALIARLLFCLRLVGATFKIKRLIVTEGVAWACMLVWNMLFAKGNMPWLRILLFLGFAVISTIVMIVDDMLATYVTRDAED